MEQTHSVLGPRLHLGPLLRLEAFLMMRQALCCSEEVTKVLHQKI